MANVLLDKRRKVLSALSLSAIIAVLFYGLCTSPKWREDSVLIWDAAGYYTYIPGAIIYKDLDRLDWYPKISERYHFAAADNWYAVYQHPQTGRRFTKYPVGVALLEAPFAVAAHALVSATHRWPADGYSKPYQFAVALADSCLMILGLLLLRVFLLRHFRDGVVGITLLLLFFGTNLYREALYDYGTSHIPVFSLFCAILWCNDTARRRQSKAWPLLLGALAGLTTITRPTEGLILLPIFLWNVHSRETFRHAFRYWLAPRRWIPFAIGFGLLLLVQLGYWRYTTGHWIYFSYTEEYFDFRHPMLLKGLFGFRKGWFVYTPLVLLTLLFGLPALVRERRGALLPLLSYLLPAVYVAFSWWMWFYASSFGCRALVGSYALLSLPLAALLTRGAQWRSPARLVLAASLVFCAALNLFQTWQYQHGILSWDKMTARRYWRVFGRTEVPPARPDELVPDSNYLERPQREIQ